LIEIAAPALRDRNDSAGKTDCGGDPDKKNLSNLKHRLEKARVQKTKFFAHCKSYSKIVKTNRE
jgi:hypothetical protein